MKRLWLPVWTAAVVLLAAWVVGAQEVKIVAVGTAADRASDRTVASDEKMPAAKFCPTCKHFFPPADRFCRVDGVPLADAEPPRPNARVCPRCKQSFESTAKYCPRDGAPLADVTDKSSTPAKGLTTKTGTGKESTIPLGSTQPGASSGSTTADRARSNRAATDQNSPYVGAAYINALHAALVAADDDKDRYRRKADTLGEQFHTERRKALAIDARAGDGGLEAVRSLNQRLSVHFDDGRRLAREGNRNQATEEFLKFLFGTPDFDTPQADEANQFVVATLHFSVLDWLWGEPEVAVVESDQPTRRLPLGFRPPPGESRSEELPRTIVCLRDGSEMVLVPGGTEMMGNDAGPPEERPAHSVTLGAFYIDKLETSVGQYERFMAATEQRVPQPDDPAEPGQWNGRTARPNSAQLPVVHVSWQDARTFAQWSGKSLPSEAQWERAARGRFAPDYPRAADPTFARHVNAGQGSGSRGLMSVFSFPATLNPSGCQNMLGNVAEWCRDWYDPAYYANSTADEPLGPDAGELRVVRGGSWRTPLDQLGSTHRTGLPPTSRSATLGFRCVLTLSVAP